MQYLSAAALKLALNRIASKLPHQVVRENVATQLSQRSAPIPLTPVSWFVLVINGNERILFVCLFVCWCLQVSVLEKLLGDKTRSTRHYVEELMSIRTQLVQEKASLAIVRQEA